MYEKFLLKYLGTYCNVIRTYIVDDKASRVHKKGFYVSITRTVRYFLLFCGTKNLWCTKNGIICKLCFYSTEFCTFLSEKTVYCVQQNC